MAYLLLPGVPDDATQCARWPLTPFQRVGSLDIDQDLIFERREWAVQRIGWIIFLLILLAGLAGALGPGVFSHAEASSGPLTVAHERFVRKGTPSELRVRLDPGAGGNDEVTIWLSQAYLDKIEIERVLPDPVEMAASGDRVFFRFAVENALEPSEIIFGIMPSEPGMTHGQAGLIDGPTVAIDQFFYP
jgi:hypothetical protein